MKINNYKWERVLMLKTNKIINKQSQVGQFDEVASLVIGMEFLVNAATQL